MKNILLTGGTGFIGSNFIKKNKKKYKIYLLVRDTKKNKEIKKFKDVYYLFFRNINEIKNILANKKFYCFLNLATFYTRTNTFYDTIKINKANLLFPLLIMNSIDKKFLKKCIFIGTMAEHNNNAFYNPVNLYAASKKSLEIFLEFYKKKISKVKFYNLKFFETFSETDKRNKIIPNLKKCFLKKKTFEIDSKKLSLNFLHVENVITALNLLIDRNINPGSYQIKSSKFTNIKELIDNFNEINDRKINYKLLNKTISKVDLNIRKLPSWKQTIYIEDRINNLMNE